MQEQDQKIKRLRISSTYFERSIPEQDKEDILKNMGLDSVKYKIILVKPETIMKNQRFQDALKIMAEKHDLSQVVVDEAHCIDA